MYVIAKYQTHEDTAAKPVMTLFRHNLCSIDVMATSTACHGKFSDEAFSDWYTSNKLDVPTWSPVEVQLISPSAIVIKGATTTVDGIEIFIAEDDSVISTTQAKACGLWEKILDQLYDEDNEARR